MNVFLRIKDNTLRAEGIEWGPKEPQLLYCIPRDINRLNVGSFLAFKVPGHLSWSGRGEQAYRAATIYIMQVTAVYDHEDTVLDKNPNQWDYKADIVMDFPLRRGKDEQ